jgi:ABC-type transporter Mla subunit MlaD
MSQSNIPDTLPSIERLLMRIKSAEQSQQRDIRITIQEARELATDLALLTGKLGKTIEQINTTLNDLKQNADSVEIKFEGGSF